MRASAVPEVFPIKIPFGEITLFSLIFSFRKRVKNNHFYSHDLARSKKPAKLFVAFRTKKKRIGD